MDSVTNETLIGATVMIDPDAAEVKNLGPKGTITDFDGKYVATGPGAVDRGGGDGLPTDRET